MPIPVGRGRTAILVVVVVGIAVVAMVAHRRPVHKTGPTPQSVAVAPAPPPNPVENQIQIAIRPRSTFFTALAAQHLDPKLVQQWVQVARPVFNFGRIQPGHTLTLLRAAAPGAAPAGLSYQIDANHTLWLRAPAIGDATGAWTATVTTIPYVTKIVGISGTVQSSLFGAVEQAGEQDPLALELADIFGWDLDFYTDTRPGDVFRVLVEKKYLDGKFAGYGQIVAAEYVNGSRVYDALRFHDALGEVAYYRPDGHPMKRAFLRSPLKFAARISSGFSTHRFHPILKVYRAHLGTDFAAPMGTPVQTIGDGVVTRAGDFGGDGNMVQIQHTGGYQTLYLHLSRILVRVGERVAQGERIGLVGMTGLATGPHLDFRIEHNGTFEDFEILRKSLPPAEPVEAQLWGQFSALRSRDLNAMGKLEPEEAGSSKQKAISNKQ